jgi:hypothetical protein
MKILFLFYVLKSYSFQNFIQNIGYRAAQAGFNKSELVDYKIPLPPSRPTNPYRYNPRYCRCPASKRQRTTGYLRRAFKSYVFGYVWKVFE